MNILMNIIMSIFFAKNKQKETKYLRQEHNLKNFVIKIEQIKVFLRKKLLND